MQSSQGCGTVPLHQKQRTQGFHPKAPRATLEILLQVPQQLGLTERVINMQQHTLDT